MKNDTSFRRAVIIFLTFATVIFPAAAETMRSFLTAAPTIHLSAIIDKASAYDGAKVAIEGEIIGDVMARGDHSWINILDNGTAVGVWAGNDRLPEFAYVGRYGAIGDRVRITGTMRRACPEHGGDLDIHAETIEIVERGIPISHPLDLKRLSVALALCFSGVLLTILWRKRERLTK